MSVVFISEPVVRVYVDYAGWRVMYVTHEDADGYMEGDTLRTIGANKESLNRAADFVGYINYCMNNNEQFVVEHYADGSTMMKLYR